MTPAEAGPCRGADPVLAEPACAHERIFHARPDQVREARRFVAGALDGCPVADDVVLCVSELAGNCVTHSASGQPGGRFTVRAEVREGEYIWLEVSDDGGPWHPPTRDDRLHGLEIVHQLASEMGVTGAAFTGWVVWARIDWPSAGG